MEEKASSIKLVQVGKKRSLQRAFIQFPKELYQDSPFYVSAFDLEMRILLRKKHPFFLHSAGEFFLVRRGEKVVGRFLICENNRYNQFHGTSYAFFDFFDSIDDFQVATAIFDAMKEWAKEHGLSALAGPMLSGGAGGAGVLIEGFEYLPAMTMMRYNYSYYRKLLEEGGFTKLVDLHSFSVPPEAMKLPERVERLSEIVAKRGRFSVLRFKSKREVLKVVDDIKALYGVTLNHHVEDYPLTKEELDQVEKDLLTVLRPDLIALLAYDGKVIGYAFGFADISPVLIQNRGHLDPGSILRLIQGMKRSRKILFNGLGILPHYQRLGGNALLYRELARIVEEGGFDDVEMVQISEQTGLMLRDAGTLGGKPFKVHRMYQKQL